MFEKFESQWPGDNANGLTMCTWNARRLGRQWGIKSIWRNDEGSVLNLVKDVRLQIQEAEKIPSKTKIKNTIPKHIMDKLLNAKEKRKILKAVSGQDNPLYTE